MSPKPHTSITEGKRLKLTCQANEATKEIRWIKDDVSVIAGLTLNRLGTTALDNRQGKSNYPQLAN